MVIKKTTQHSDTSFPCSSQGRTLLYIILVFQPYGCAKLATFLLQDVFLRSRLNSDVKKPLQAFFHQQKWNLKKKLCLTTYRMSEKTQGAFCKSVFKQGTLLYNKVTLLLCGFQIDAHTCKEKPFFTQWHCFTNRHSVTILEILSSFCLPQNT